MRGGPAAGWYFVCLGISLNILDIFGIYIFYLFVYVWYSFKGPKMLCVFYVFFASQKKERGVPRGVRWGSLGDTNFINLTIIYIKCALI